MREQLRGYPRHLAGLREAAADFAGFLDGMEGIALVMGSAAALNNCVFSQIVLRLDTARLGCSKDKLRDALAAEGITTRDANFEPIPSLSFFRGVSWREWLLKGDADRMAAMQRHMLLGRISAAEDHAALYVLLAAREESPYVTGAMFLSDGGLTISV